MTARISNRRIDTAFMPNQCGVSANALFLSTHLSIRRFRFVWHCVSSVVSSSGPGVSASLAFLQIANKGANLRIPGFEHRQFLRMCQSRCDIATVALERDQS